MAGNEEAIANEMKEVFKDKILETSTPRPRRLFVAVSPDSYRSLIQFLVEKAGLLHLSTIVGVDTGKTIDVMPQLFGRGIEVTVRVSLPREKPVTDTIGDIRESAYFYEREVYDLLGVEFRGHPNLTRLLLAEEWPEGVYPLRKEFKTKSQEPLRKTGE
jgi:NADH:ubiquinone oxidoreductase subunit C